MGENTKIEWTDHTFNPWIGCTRVSAGCAHCYAARDNSRRHWLPYWGPGARKRTAESTWGQPRKWARAVWFECSGCGFRFPAKTLGDPSACVSCGMSADHARPTRARVFSASLADWLDPEVPPEWRWNFCRLTGDTPELDWLLLTKRIDRDRDLLADLGLIAPENWWLGISAENQLSWDHRVATFLDHPATVRFVSCEPLLGPIDLRGLRPDWIIVGGETGPQARPMRPEWVLSLRDQCAAAGIPFFFKQWGGRHKDAMPQATLEGIHHRAFPAPARGK